MKLKDLLERVVKELDTIRNEFLLYWRDKNEHL